MNLPMDIEIHAYLPEQDYKDAVARGTLGPMTGSRLRGVEWAFARDQARQKQVSFVLLTLRLPFDRNLWAGHLNDCITVEERLASLKGMCWTKENPDEVFLDGTFSYLGNVPLSWIIRVETVLTS